MRVQRPLLRMGHHLHRPPPRCRRRRPAHLQRPHHPNRHNVVPAQHHPQDEEPYQPVDAANIGERQTNNTLGGAKSKQHSGAKWACHSHLEPPMKRSGPSVPRNSSVPEPMCASYRLSRRRKPVQPELPIYLRGRSRTELVNKILVEDGVTNLPVLPLTADGQLKKWALPHSSRRREIRWPGPDRRPYKRLTLRGCRRRRPGGAPVLKSSQEDRTLPVGTVLSRGGCDDPVTRPKPLRRSRFP